jgi:hypothetical protein
VRETKFCDDDTVLVNERRRAATSEPFELLIPSRPVLPGTHRFRGSISLFCPLPLRPRPHSIYPGWPPAGPIIWPTLTAPIHGFIDLAALQRIGMYLPVHSLSCYDHGEDLFSSKRGACQLPSA